MSWIDQDSILVRGVFFCICVVREHWTSHPSVSKNPQSNARCIQWRLYRKYCELWSVCERDRQNSNYLNKIHSNEVERKSNGNVTDIAVFYNKPNFRRI